MKLPTQLLINLFIAFLWMFLNDSWSPLSFFSGYLIGLIVLFVLRRFIFKSFYLYRAIAVLKLFFVFISELISSSILVARQVTQPRLTLTPGVFTIETDLKGEWEITLLSLLISLTPGSIVLKVSHDQTKLEVHAMDLPESKEAVIKAQYKFEKAIKGVTR